MLGFKLIEMLTERFRVNGTAGKPVVFRVEKEARLYEATGEMHNGNRGQSHVVVLRAIEGPL